MSTALLKTIVSNSIAEGLYKEVASRVSRYHFFLGKTLSWQDEELPPFPLDTFKYELDTRNEIILSKEIGPSDIALVVRRIDWQYNAVYDMYDDRYGTEVIGIDLISNGTGYTVAPTVTIEGGGGTGATAYAEIFNGGVTGIVLTNPGVGYISTPTVTFSGPYGTGAVAQAVLSVSASGKQKLEDCDYYVMTDEFNVYKCLDNNGNSPSTVKPYGNNPEPITLQDGYVWKFMYAIPISLRNKFVTDEWIPSLTALRSQFYSNGDIQKINIVNSGSGYTYATANIIGDGYLEKDPVYITDYVITDNGSGYEVDPAPTVFIDPPYNDVFPWQANTIAIINQKVQYGLNIYQVVIAGTFGAFGPVHLDGFANNGTTALKYIGTQARGVAEVGTGADAGKIVGLTLIGKVRRVRVNNGGTGYNAPPPVTITGGAGSGALAYAIVYLGSIIDIVVTSEGDDYTSAPTVVVGTPWEASASVGIGDQLFYQNNLYTVTVPGTLSATTPPTHSAGSDANGTATLAYAGTPADCDALLRFGTGYSSMPNITINGSVDPASLYLSGTKSNATLRPIIEDGSVVDVQILEAGTGYSVATIQIGGDGSGADVVADLSIGNIDTRQADVEILTPDGGLSAIKLISGGYGYADANVIITGDGIGATAEAVIQAGRVVKINITSYGSGYRWANVQISGSGYGATARAIISPYGGHGKDSVNELYARTLMFFSTISRERAQGFEINNDYRQFGIIKNLRAYGTTYNFNQRVGTSCWVVGSDVNTTEVQPDDLLYRKPNNEKFRVVSVTEAGLLIQSLDNAEPVIGDLFARVQILQDGTVDQSYTFNANAVTAPDFDKYSGDLLYIDNRQAFAPSVDEIATLRTIIKF